MDARSIANCILDHADARDIECSHLKLQKLLYFVHGRWLTKYDQPLCDGTFEAWPHGPVHPLVYQAFKDSGSSAIKTRASSFDPISRAKSEIEIPRNQNVLDEISVVVFQLGGLTGSQLRNITHSKGGPWGKVVESSGQSANIGMKMVNDVIKKYFGKQLYLVGGGPEERELDEDAPFTRD